MQGVDRHTARTARGFDPENAVKVRSILTPVAASKQAAAEGRDLSADPGTSSHWGGGGGKNTIKITNLTEAREKRNGSSSIRRSSSFLRGSLNGLEEKISNLDMLASKLYPLPEPSLVDAREGSSLCEQGRSGSRVRLNADTSYSRGKRELEIRKS